MVLTAFGGWLLSCLLIFDTAALNSFNEVQMFFKHKPYPILNKLLPCIVKGRGLWYRLPSEVGYYPGY